MKFNPAITYTKSSFVQAVRNGAFVVIWHSLFGYPKIISAETFDFLELFSKPTTIHSLFAEEVSNENQNAIEELQRCHYLIPEGFDERAFLEEQVIAREKDIISGSRINYLGLVMSDACNFRCTYCIHFNNLESLNSANAPEKFMRFEMAKEAVDSYIGILRKSGNFVAEINFGGGEPLMAWSAIKQVLEYCCATYALEFDLRFSINTNAALITKDVAMTLKKYRVEIASSLDGLRRGNNRVRLTKSGGGTFSRITSGFKRLERVKYPLEGISVTVSEANFYELDEAIVDWAIAHNMKDVRIDVDVVDGVKISNEAVIEKLMRIRRYASDRGVNISGFWSRPTENLNQSSIDDCVAFCGAVRGNSMCVRPSGDIYGCGYSTIQLGSLSTIQAFHVPGSAYHRFIKDHSTGAVEMCKGCIIEGQCNGGCNITQEFARGIETEKIKRMCDFYRRMTQEILREQLQEVPV